MSEFQYYEFVAIDCPLIPAAQKALRAITNRTAITATRLVNTYEWGDFNALLPMACAAPPSLLDSLS